MLSGGDAQRLLAAILLLLMSVFIPVSLSVALQPAGDVAPYGNPDGQLNAADLAIVLQFLNGQKTPTTQEEQICDVAPYGSPDGVLNVGDYLVLQRAVMGLISLDPIGTPLQPLIWGGASPTDASPYYVSGLTDPNITVQLYRDGVAQGSTFSNNNGLFNFNVQLVAGAVHSITAVSVQGGVQSDPSAPLTIIMLAQPAPADLTQIAITYNATDTSIVGQAGSVAANSTVTITLVDGSTYTVTADSGGAFSTTIGDTDLVASFTVDTGSGKVSDPAIVTAVGTVAGTSGVSDTGAATYSVPIAVPPGTAGMQPNLNLTYSSQSGNGLLGVGWSLGGLSAITRCPANLAQDGFIDPVDFDSNDRFCLDGRRLVEVANTTCSAHGGVNEYRTEIESFTRVCAIGSQASGPQSFMVWTKAGQVIEFGVSGDARIEAEGEMQGVGEVIVWAANKVSDKMNNYMTIGYIEDNPNGTYKVDRIDYTFNDSQGLGGFASVEFSYETRTDITRQYIAGSLTGNDVRLKTIKTLIGATPVREYTLGYNYSPDTGRSRLISIAECNGYGECIVPTVFTYNENTVTANTATSWGSFAGTVATGAFFNEGVFDIDGDGQQDYVFRLSGSKVINAMLSTGASLSGPVAWGSYTGTESSSTTFFNAGVMDVDADGLVDFVYRNDASSSLNVMLNTGSSFSAPVSWGSYTGTPSSSMEYFNSEFIDVTGDGRPEFLYRESGSKNINVMINTGASFDAPVSWGAYTGTEASDQYFFNSGFADVDGDGLGDFIYRNSGSKNLNVMLSTGSTFTSPTSWGAYTGAETTSPNINITQFADINSDGKQDFIYSNYGSNNINVLLSTGLSFAPPQSWGVIATTYSGGGYCTLPEVCYGPMALPGVFSDINGDGLPDYVYKELFFTLGGQPPYKLIENQTNVMLNTGVSLEAPYIFSDYRFLGNHTNLYLVEMVDVVGKGLSSLILRRSSELFVASGNSPSSDLLDSYTNGLGITTYFSYSPITADQIYTKGSSSSFPQVDFQGPVYVVNQTSIVDGVGGNYLTSYSYANAVLDLHGRGFLGFGEVSSTDSQTTVTTQTVYRQDYPYTGMVSRSESIYGGQVFKSVDNQLNQVVDVNGHAGVVYPYVSTSTGEEYDLPANGGMLFKTVVTTTTYDTSHGGLYGNPENITVTTTGNGITFTKTTVNQYDAPDLTAWILDRLGQTMVTHSDSRTEIPDVVKTSAFTYYTAGSGRYGLLDEEIIEPGQPTSSPLRLTTKHEYDDFGNEIKVTQTGLRGWDAASGQESRFTQTAYDGQGRFKLGVQNALLHTEVHSYDPRFGLQDQLTGPNGLETTWIYDGFGRKVKETRADGTQTTWSYAFCNSTICPANGAFYETIKASGSAPVIKYYDALQRVIRTETSSLTGQTIYQDMGYDAKGNTERASRPYFMGGVRQDTVFEYDDLNRPKKETAPDGGIVNYTYTDYARNTTRTDLSGTYSQTDTRINNAQDQLEATIDAMNGIKYFHYFADGNLWKASDSPNPNAGTIVTTNTYDIRGRKLTMDDPDMGQWAYKYNAFGELVWQQDAKGQVVTMAYDLLGRMINRTEPETAPAVTDVWTYDSASMAKGKLVSMTSSASGHTRTFSYDGQGRLASEVSVLGSESFTMAYTYDGFSRMETVTYPTGYKVRNIYNATGHMTEVRDAANDSLYWQATEDDADGHVTMETLGNGLETIRIYNPANGYVDTISTGVGVSAPTIQDLRYQFDPLGNLELRHDQLQNLTEDFTYDNLNRLDTVTLNGLGPKTYQYDSLGFGNIDVNPDYGDKYVYSGVNAGPHAVTEVKNGAATLATYSYDANGNMYSDSTGRTIQWNSFNKAAQISRGATTINFDYDAEHNRVRQQVVGGKTIYYLNPRIDVGINYEKTIDGSTIEHTHYIHAGGRVVALYTQKSDGTEKTRYLHTDHLGSTDVITDEGGNEVERQSFSPFGSRRNVSDWSNTGVLAAIETHHGFTGHEQLDDVGIIHMNGRLYDPQLGRFLSADPTVQYPDNTQSYNRYTYVNNNPLSYTDPSGYGWLSDAWKAVYKYSGLKALVHAAKKVVNWFLHNPIGQAILTIGAAIACGPAAAVCAAAVSGGLTLVNGGSIEDALIAAAITYASIKAFGEIARLRDAGTLNNFQTVLASGAVGGTASKLQGGKFVHGFASAGITSGTGLIDGFYVEGATTANTIKAAIVGGAASVAGGGKFANGAITGAFARLYAGGGINGQSSDSGGGFFKGALDVVGKIWALPNTIVGLTVGGFGYGVGWAGYGLGFLDVAPSVSIRNNAIWFENIPFGEGAITIGNAVISTPGWGPTASREAYGVIQPIGPHEQSHTYQYQALGPFFAPAYFLSGGAFTSRSPFEAAATRHATGNGGWWPW